MIRLSIYRDGPLCEPEEYETEDLCAWLYASFDGHWPATAKLYSGSISPETEIDVQKAEVVAWLETMQTGHFIAVVYPAHFLASIAETILHVVSFGLLFGHKQNTKPVQEQSPNNSLSDRQNTARPNERIPWIAGTVRATPDLIAQPYRIFVNNLELAFAPMCVGVGSHTILDVKDDVTPVQWIDGEFVAVYGPNSSPNGGQLGAVPIQTFGTNPYGSVPPIVTAQLSNSINGQVLRAPNSGNLNTDNNVGFVYPDGMYTGSNGGDPAVDFTEYFIPSTEELPQTLTIATNDDGINASDPNGNVGSVGLAGTYTILDVTQTSVTLSNPASVNSNWNTIQQFAGQQSTLDHSFAITGDGDVWVGPYILEIADLTEVWCNFIAQDGLYRIDSSGNQHAMSVTIQVGVTAVDNNYNPVGDEVTQNVTLTGSALAQKTVGATLQMSLQSSGYVQVRAQRLTNMGTDNNSQYHEQIQWRDLYGVSPIGVTDFGNVTTLFAITAPTQDALAQKDRKLNLLVTRNLPTWQNRSGFAYTGSTSVATFGGSYPTNNAADIICAMALDPTIGRRTASEIDVAGIYAVADSAQLGAGHVNGQIASYFGSFLPTEFCYTFDDSKTSFEESMQDIAQALNCTAYRQGSTLSLYFEGKTAASTLLFNHRNKVPDSEQRTFTFGTLNENDGIEYDYIDPNAPNFPNIDTTVTLYFPTDQSAQNPKKITSKGVRNVTQAYVNGWRLYQKLILQNEQVQFEATQEAAMAIQYERVLVADNTRSDTQDGEVVSSNGLTLELSQPVTFAAGVTYSMFLQLTDGSTQSIPVTAGASAFLVVLSSAPRLPVVTSQSMWARTTYVIAGSSAVRANAFLVAKKEIGNSQSRTYKMTCVTYNDLYYVHDTDIAANITPIPPTGYGPQGYTGSGTVAAPVGAGG